MGSGGVLLKKKGAEQIPIKHLAQRFYVFLSFTICSPPLFSRLFLLLISSHIGSRPCTRFFLSIIPLF